MLTQGEPFCRAIFNLTKILTEYTNDVIQTSIAFGVLDCLIFQVFLTLTTPTT